jgi:hypothetical protein
MEDLLLNGELVLPLPAGFRVMDEEEKSKLRFLAEGECVCLSDPERHLLLTVGWKPLGGLARLMLNAGDAAKNAEKAARGAMRDTGYRCLGFEKQRIAGASAEGFRYEYTAQGIPMAADILIAKINKSFYYFNFYSRAESGEASFRLWEEFLGSVRKADA